MKWLVLFLVGVAIWLAWPAFQIGAKYTEMKNEARAQAKAARGPTCEQVSEAMVLPPGKSYRFQTNRKGFNIKTERGETRFTTFLSGVKTGSYLDNRGVKKLDYNERVIDTIEITPSRPGKAAVVELTYWKMVQ